MDMCGHGGGSKISKKTKKLRTSFASSPSGKIFSGLERVLLEVIKKKKVILIRLVDSKLGCLFWRILSAAVSKRLFEKELQCWFNILAYNAY